MNRSKNQYFVSVAGGATGRCRSGLMSALGPGCVKTRCRAKRIELIFIGSRFTRVKFSSAVDFDQYEKYYSHRRRAFGVFTQPGSFASLAGAGKNRPLSALRR